MFWKRMTAQAGFWSLLLGTLASFTVYLLYKAGTLGFGSDLEESFWGSGIAFVTVVIVALIITPLTTPKPHEDLRGLVYGLESTGGPSDALAGDAVWYRSPLLLGGIAVALSVLLYIPFW
ncbi:hypothetical protein ACIA8K_12430 [Catenuloplanes sp. NPDC051500]|uniref:hypothetical protein n=1 Tax=Catenuloplanes sp. NPDC051500 TaxID=3363959 RepID=UPI0037B4A87B